MKIVKYDPSLPTLENDGVRMVPRSLTHKAQQLTGGHCPNCGNPWTEHDLEEAEGCRQEYEKTRPGRPGGVMKLKWRVGVVPTGQYRSFRHRSWPMAYHPNGQPAVQITCDEGYHPESVKTGQHEPLIAYVADHSRTPWEWRRVKKQFATLDELKVAVTSLLKRNPQLTPKEAA